MAQNNGSRARPWANVSLPNGPWAPFVAIAAVLATVALVANGPRIGGDSPAVPDGRTYATAETAPASGPDRREPEDPIDGPPIGDRELAPAKPSAPRTRRRTPTASHRQRRTAPARPRARAPRARRPSPAAAPSRALTGPSATWHSEPAARRAPTPHRAPISSAEREFGP